MDTVSLAALSYAYLFCTAGASGAAWYLYRVAWDTPRQQFRLIRLCASITTPGVLAIAYCAIRYGDSLQTHWHAAFGWSSLIGITGLPCWVLSMAIGRKLIEASRNITFQIKGDDDDKKD